MKTKLASLPARLRTPTPTQIREADQEELANRVLSRQLSRLSLRSLGGHSPHLAPADEAAEGAGSFVRRHISQPAFDAPLAPADEPVEDWTGSESDSSSATSISERSDEERAHRRLPPLLQPLTCGHVRPCTLRPR
jgi:hypothetical protein